MLDQLNPDQNSKLRKLLSTDDAARILRTGANNVRRLARELRLPVAFVVGYAQRLFWRADVERLAREREDRRATPGVTKTTESVDGETR